MQSNSNETISDELASLLLKAVRWAVPIFLIALGCFLVIQVLVFTKPSAERQGVSTAPAIIVEVLDLQPIDYEMTIDSYGTVQPRTQSFVVSQVSGMVTSIADNFRDGAFINKGDVLLTIDQRDYLADVNIAEASLADASQAYAEESARSEQARIDWERLGQDGEPSDLVLRKPQLQAAKARMLSADSALSKAKLSLERTTIVAPFDGRLIRSFVDVGQVVGNNTQLGEIYATDYVEVRLPLRDSDLPFVELPEEYREGGDPINQPDVEIHSGFGNGDSWVGKIVRVESTIDTSARQLHVVAQIDDPFSSQQSQPIKIGQYVIAKIEGKTIQDAVVIPNAAIYQNSFVYIAEEGVLQRRDISISWQSGDESIINSGLQFGDKLVTTPLGQVTSGTRIAIAMDDENSDTAVSEDTRITESSNEGEG